MRRLMRLSALFLVLTTSLLWSDVPDPFDDPLHVQSAVAQPPAPGLMGPGGIIFYTASSSTVVNSVQAVNLFDYTLPAALVATASFISVTGTTTTFNVVAASVPLHLHCNGRLNQASGALNVAVAFGPPSTALNAAGNNFATLSLVSGHGDVFTQAPLLFDAYLAPLATSTAPQSTSVVLNARLSIGVSGASGTGATETAYNAMTTAAPILGVPNQLRVQWQFNTAANGNAATFYHCTLLQGN